MTNNTFASLHQLLNRVTKLVDRAGDWGPASWGTLRQIFYTIFLTDVVGLGAGLPSFAAPAGVVWDAVNNPLVGLISDRIHTRWGCRLGFPPAVIADRFTPLWRCPFVDVLGSSPGKPARPGNPHSHRPFRRGAAADSSRHRLVLLLDPPKSTPASAVSWP